MTTATQSPAPTRLASKEKHRLALIEATADAIQELGLAGVSISRILERAGLSRGMVNLHFSSKSKLLLEVARHFSDAYIANWQRAMEGAGTRPESRLRAIITADFDPSVLNRRTMAVWLAFRSEAQSSPDYMPFIETRDDRLQSTFDEICAELCADGPYPGVDPRLAALAFNALLEGLWTDYHLHPDRFQRDEARAIVLHMAAAFFPRHFPGPDQAG